MSLVVEKVTYILNSSQNGFLTNGMTTFFLVDALLKLFSTADLDKVVFTTNFVKLGAQVNSNFF
jgi:hypothetical protein